jgi:uncharacterized protein (DUF2062 family)
MAASSFSGAASAVHPGSFNEFRLTTKKIIRGFSKGALTQRTFRLHLKLLRLQAQRVSVSVAVLLLVFGSVTPVGIETVAVLEIELVADALIVPVAL